MEGVNQEAIKNTIGKLQETMREPEKALELLELAQEIRPAVQKAAKIVGCEAGGEEGGILAGFLYSMGSDA